MKSWKVKFKGRVERIIIFYAGLISMVISFMLANKSTKRGDFFEMTSFDLFMLVIFTSFLWIPVLYVTWSKLFSSKIPKEIRIDEDSKMCEIIFSHHQNVFIPFESLAYSYSNKYTYHKALTLYKTFIGTRGQDVFIKITEVIGLNYTFSWKIYQLQEIVRELEKLGIMSRTADNEDLPLWERMIS